MSLRRQSRLGKETDPILQKVRRERNALLRAASARAARAKVKTEIEKLEHRLAVEQTQLASAHTRRDLATDDITKHDLAVKKILCRMMKLNPNSWWLDAAKAA